MRLLKPHVLFRKQFPHLMGSGFQKSMFYVISDARCSADDFDKGVQTHTIQGGNMGDLKVNRASGKHFLNLIRKKFQRGYVKVAAVE